MKKAPLIPPTKNTPAPKPAAPDEILIKGDPAAFMGAIQRNATGMAADLCKAQDLVALLMQALDAEKTKNKDLQAKLEALDKKGGK